MASRLKNYTTKVSAKRSIQEITEALAEAGASSIILELSAGETVGLTFAIESDDRLVNYRLPVDTDRVRAVLIEDRINRAIQDDAYVRRVAWRSIRDWVLAQIAITRTAQIEVSQAFLPYALVATGETLHSALRSGAASRLLTGGEGR